MFVSAQIRCYKAQGSENQMQLLRCFSSLEFVIGEVLSITALGPCDWMLGECGWSYVSKEHVFFFQLVCILCQKHLEPKKSILFTKRTAYGLFLKITKIK